MIDTAFYNDMAGAIISGDYDHMGALNCVAEALEYLNPNQRLGSTSDLLASIPPAWTYTEGRRYSGGKQVYQIAIALTKSYKSSPSLTNTVGCEAPDRDDARMAALLLAAIAKAQGKEI